MQPLLTVVALSVSFLLFPVKFSLGKNTELDNELGKGGWTALKMYLRSSLIFFACFGQYKTVALSFRYLQQSHTGITL